MKEINEIQNQIIKVLKYFSFFHFPLTKDEVLKFIELKVDENLLFQNLDELVNNEHIFEIDNCYLLANEPITVSRKREGKICADKRMKRAKWISKIIMSFPFVRMVAVSGSLSKGYADKSTDIDFFIVTTENQLWTSRSLLHILKKISFLFRMEHSFCMNYFIAENHLTLDEKNYFTAIEMATLIPMRGHDMYEKLIEENKWFIQFVPNSETLKIYNPKNRIGIIKGFFEKILYSKNLNRRLMNFTDKRWRKKWKSKNFELKEYDLAFKTKLTVSKNHPGNYQKKILEHMDEKIKNPSHKKNDYI